LQIPQGKLTDISLDFTEGLAKSRGKDVILVVVDRLTKYAHFLPLIHPFSASQVSKLFMDNIHRLHGLPRAIVSDIDIIFTSAFWQEVFSALQVELHFSTSYHPESDGQTERVNQCLEQYLRSMAFKEPQKWADLIPAAEWWYNIAYHTSLKKSPFEALYGYKPPQLGEVAIPCNVASEVEVTLLEQENAMKAL
jgi:transposase InsO family protein